MSIWSADICSSLRSLQDSTGIIPPYDSNSVHKTREIISSILQEVAQTDESLQVRAIILKQHAARLQEGIDLYHRARLQRILEVMNKSRAPLDQESRKALSPSEVEFVNSYQQKLAAFKRETKFEAFAPFKPPLGLNAEVKVLREAGSIFVGDSFLSLNKNDVLTLRTNVAQELERNGFVEIIEYLK
ncbi:DNA replication complex GINS protein psf1 [Histomonas meleagridis]|uniref:DNA replication complex GINS protein psf1 n=1 Tax=Histomonas meleagridis TaxID=135588 RepID=UPI0035598E9F|nr:DNA replication complex GINS protein psf1 [Histomonas meleagridis]KAH0796456.1 DNA replication complex GINS protein psf1 [Histomonas meleagridis]